MATMVEVARLAGVSISTVSHVVNGTRAVSADTARRVSDAIAKTGYRQDAVARAMRRSQTDSIGLVVCDVAEPAFAEMIRGVERASNEAGLTLLLASSHEDEQLERRAVDSLLDRRVDGLVVTASAGAGSVAAATADRSVPVVLLDRLFADAELDQVGADNRESMEQLVQHLQRQGHERFLLVAGDLRVPTLQERHRGFVDAIGGGEARVLQGEDPELLASELIARLRDFRPTCVIAASSPLAAIALRGIGAEGLRVPADVAFATFDGFAHSDLFSPTLTCVRQPAAEMGQVAVEMLLARMRTPGARPRTMRLRQWMELGESTEAFLRAQNAGPSSVL